MHTWRITILALLALTYLSGCAPVMVGGAATGGAMAIDRRTPGAFIDDERIEWTIRNAIRQDQELSSQSNVSVVSYDGVVLLAGEAPTESLRARAAEHARNVEKVRRVHNELVIAAPSSLMTRSSDTAITTRVKTRILGIRGLEGFDGTKVKVVTENGTVFLMGKVLRREADVVTDTARQVSGVQRIVRLFEYLD
ncbi:MAG: BON domain-containing protein [Gammaproteobacteria bacterium]|nr:BON domain-containing protein [Gammaproteobacteria bacterium]MCW9057730.1 BON domain-containing protein [Gammaproteobacteria bacterium]